MDHQWGGGGRPSRPPPGYASAITADVGQHAARANMDSPALRGGVLQLSSYYVSVAENGALRDVVCSFVA